MSITSGEQIYVAELRVPTCFYPSEEKRYSLRDPAGFQVSKGYYAIRPPDERSNLGGYAELGLVIEFVSQGLREAEDRAFKVGGIFGSVAAAFGGYPLESPYLRRIAHVGIHGDLKSQHEYSYGVKPYVLTQFDYEGGHQFDRYLQSISATDAKTRYQIQSAIHWFAICIGADDPAVSFVAAWTGLECIGEIIHQKAHPNGPKAPCKTCGNIPGKNRKRKEAGIDHMFNSLIKGPLSTSLSDEARQALDKDFQGSLSSKDAGCLRHSIVHGLRDIETIARQSSHSRRFVADVLNAAIHIGLGDHVNSWLPGDYGLYPNVRCSLRFKDGYRRSPFHGQWGAELRTELLPDSPVEEKPVTGSFRMEWPLDGSAIGFVDFSSSELFSWESVAYDLSNQSEVTGLPNWHDRPSEPPWKEWGGPE